MKKIYSFLLFIALASVAMAQKPCTWGGDIPPADPVVQISDSCYRVPEGEPAPQFDASGTAKIDPVWGAAKRVPIAKHVAGSTPDPQFEAISKFMYDDEWMYILIVVSGDLEIDIVGSATEQDRIEFMFQNTYGGKGTAAEHCDDANFFQRYWEQDGDRKFVMPANRDVNLVWLDQDVDDVCGGNDCSEITGDDWLTYSALNILKYNTYTGGDTIIYECAFHLKNWMKYSYTDIAELEGHKYGFDFSVRDVDGIAGMTDHINLNDPGNDAYAWTTVLADFTFNARPLPDTNIISDIAFHKAAVEFSVFPNPASSEINIKSDLNISKIEISNIVGQIVQTEFNVNETVNIATLKEGIYIINVYSNKNELIGTEKIFKQ